MSVGAKEKMDFLYEALKQKEYFDNLKILYYPSTTYEGQMYLKIYDRNATKENMIMYLKQMTGLKNVVTFGTIPDKYDILIQADNANEVVRETKKMYEKLFF